MTQNASAGGATLSYGVATPVMRGPIPVKASGYSLTSGKATAAIGYPAAAMTDFSLGDPTYSDVARTRVVADLQGNDATAAWNRRWVAATAPAPYYAGNGQGALIWGGAAKAAVQPIYQAVPANEFHYMDGVQFEVGSTPTNYANARAIIATMHPDRLNWAPNPSWQANYSDNWAGGDTASSAIVFDTFRYLYGNQSLKIQAGGTSDVFSSIGGKMNLQPGGTYTLSFYVYAPVVTYIPLFFTGFYELGGYNRWTPIGYYGQPQILYGLQWNRISGQLYIPMDWTSPTSLLVRCAYDSTVTTPDKNVPLWYTGVLVEQSTTLGEYFDGSSTNTDTLWENGTMDPSYGSRSFYYLNYRAKHARLNDIVGNYLGIGRSYTLNYAVPPSTTPLVSTHEEWFPNTTRNPDPASYPNDGRTSN